MTTNEAGLTEPSGSDAALRAEPGQIASRAGAITEPLTALVDRLDTPAAGQIADRVTSHASGIAQGAVLIAGLTSLSRMLGLVRTLVFSQSVGAGCLGTAYTTANGVPNLIYELALGGALTSAMVPVLARSAVDWIKPGDLLLRDLGYAVLPIWQELLQRGAYFVSRLRSEMSLANRGAL